MIQLPAPDFVQITDLAIPRGVALSLGLYYLDDNSVALFSSRTPQAGGSGFSVQVFDASGAFTLYSTGFYQYNQEGTPFYIASVIPIGSGVFVVSMTDNYDVVTFVLPLVNAKLNNSAPLSLLPFSVPQNPCYNGNPKFFYDNVKKILCVGFYNPTGQEGGPVFASFYSVTRRGLLPLRSGFVGYYSPGYDPLAQNAYSTQGLTILSGTLVNQTNGVQTQLFYNRAGYGVVLSANTIDPGLQTDCVTPSGASVGLRASQLYYPQDNNYDEFQNTFDTNISGIATGGPYDSGTGLSGTAVQFFDIAGNVYSFGKPGSANVQVVLTKSAAWLYFGDNHIYRGTIQTPFAGKVSRAVSPLVNLHRPVSIFGAYKS